MEIRKLRKLTGLTQKQFSDKYGIPISTLKNWEYGYRECPKYLIDLLEYKVKDDMNKKI